MGTNQKATNSKSAENDNNSTESRRTRYFEALRFSRSILNGIINGMHTVKEIPSTPCKIIRIKKEDHQHSIIKKKKEENPKQEPTPGQKSTSMTSLILWNISKSLEMNPGMDLKNSIQAAQQRLETNCLNISSVLSPQPEQQYLVCALLAWQKLGHHDADSLYKFIDSKRKDVHTGCMDACSSKLNHEKTTLHSTLNDDASAFDSLKSRIRNEGCCINTAQGSFGSHSSGPVLKLPVDTKVIMRCDASMPCQKLTQKKESQNDSTKSQLEDVCCLESQCAERLAALDAATNELRSRASKLARREAERVELLERAEAAWRDLEIGYQRRLSLAVEKEDDISKQIEKLILERNSFKNGCADLATQLKDRGDIVDEERDKLMEVEKLVCNRACTKMRLGEEVAKSEATLAEHQCKAAQFDRDLQFKEDQARRKLASLESEAESARALTLEAERVMRAELGGLREQIGEVSDELLQEDEANIRIKEELDQLRQAKMEMVEDLEGCKVTCDLRMQGQVDALNKKKEMLNSVKEEVMECRCKMPVDATVEAKRTPSLAALCRCAPEDRLLESCSCTSLRDRLLSNLLADLFGGLQTELGSSGSEMPCQLLKCLEDNHNWDRASVTKTNLRNFFSKLLLGELDIALATAIEKYHAKWVGASCADVGKLIPNPDDDLNEGWEQRALEKRAQRMASQLAEQLFEERADQLAQRARDIASSGPPPCECRPPKGQASSGPPPCECRPPKGQASSGPPPCECRPLKGQAAVYPCLMPPNMSFPPGSLIVQKPGGTSTPSYWKRTIRDVTQLRLQIEDLKKESIKKEDLKLMEEKIASIVKQASVTEDPFPPIVTKDTSNIRGESSNKKESKHLKVDHQEAPKSPNPNRSGVSKKKTSDNSPNLSRKSTIHERPSKQPKKQLHGQSYAVNLCLCGIQKNSKHLQNSQFNSDGKSSWKSKPSRDIIPQNSIVKQSKPISLNLPSSDLEQNDSKISDTCNSNCKCFHKMPSNTSIDKLLETLTKWKFDLVNPQEKCIKHIKSSFSKYSKTAIKETLRITNLNDSKINLSISTESNKEHVNDIYKEAEFNVETDKNSSLFKQPLTTESEYMGAVNLEKSNENICKCILNIEAQEENNLQKNVNGINKAPFKCINSIPCECKIYQEMQKDHKRSQTEELNKVEILDQSQMVHSRSVLDISQRTVSTKCSSQLNCQKEIKQISDTTNTPQTTQMFPSNCDYYIKFLGVTLDDYKSHKKTKRKIKDVDNSDELSTVKDPLSDIQKKLSHIEPALIKPSNIIPTYTLPSNTIPSNTIPSITPPSNPSTKRVVSVDENNQSELSKTYVCECNAKFDEFKSFMNNFLSSQFHSSIPSKDEGLDSQGFKICAENKIEPCDCCNSLNVDDSKDLEVNAFHLLEDHLKGKLEEFKSLTCKSTCIPPEEEEKLFSAILKRVKQVISDCANEMKCNCPERINNNGSWKRAYGLLQEYLKIKIKRVQCLCVLNNNKSIVLPDILDKVCNLIENDFQRLKDICKCKNPNEIHKKYVSIDVNVTPAKELPEKDTNTSEAKYDIVEVQTFPGVNTSSKQNSNKSIILKENISSQVPANLGMEAKSCDIMAPVNKNAITTETEDFVTESKSNGVMYNKCDCNYNIDKQNSAQFSELHGTNEVLVNIVTNEVKSGNDIYEMPIIDKNQKQSRCCSPVGSETMKVLPNVCENKTNKLGLVDAQDDTTDQTTRVPYIGYTVDCSCDDALGCVCMKSVVQANNDKIDNLFKQYLANHSNNQNYSYIMHGTRNKNDDIIVTCHSHSDNRPTDDIPNAFVQKNDKVTCESQVSAHGGNNVVLKKSHGNLNTIHHTTNTFAESMSLATSNSYNEGPLDWFECSMPMNAHRTHTSKLSNTIYFPTPIDSYDQKSCSQTVTETDALTTPQTCDCDRVPICHVKMLVENIEKNLIESKCTCDSLISKVCPVHAKRYF